MINGRFVKMILGNITNIPSMWMKLRKLIKDTDYDDLDRWNHVQYVMRKLHRKSNVNLHIHYAENRPTKSGCMIYANHQGLYDPVAIAANSVIPLGAVCKIELEKVPVIKDIIKATKTFCIDRNSVKQSLKVFNSVTDEVKSGKSYVIFPEGTRSKNGNEMLEFHAAAFRCAIKAKCDIYPIAFVDSYKAFDKKGFGKVDVHMHYLPCIKYEDFKDMKSTELAVLVKDKIQSVIDIYERKEEN